MTEPDYGPEPSEPPTTVRLIFEYEGTDIRLISRRRVAMMPPPSDPLREREDAQGFWVEVRDAQQRPLYRRVMCDPVRRDVEVFSDEPEYSIARVPVDEPRGLFVVLVPDIANADHAALIRSPFGLRPTAAAEVARFGFGPDFSTEEDL
ncbi:hypothetical protein [Streptomyces griseomycini]|uniref:Uncharacterized protein n=1 Tax=Streptomyces griseomycini TaxID=66895 RepID=A0A7W7LXY8_9ACTN|nr:hypothetical protein [Streptomyces griseomycini]MBB4898530.1 hypothetical protein [Streptomyces griseomycini]GGR27970.1 hypothetical protein GCM10015536_36860 [Streptomyces griseomycini]